jgi:hypothetical protein
LKFQQPEPKGGKSMEETFLATSDIVEDYLKGVTYPASRSELIRTARENDAPQEIITTLEAVEQEQLANSGEVDRAVNELR